MSTTKASRSQFNKRAARMGMILVAIIAILVFFVRPLRQFARELRMRRVTSSHYVILYPPIAVSPETMEQFASRREALFDVLNKKLGGAAAATQIRIIFDTDLPTSTHAANSPQDYSVAGTTIRQRLVGKTPQLDPAADAEALLHVRWGDPGNPRMGKWTAIALVGEWQGEELGMAAAGAEQRLGHKKVSALLDPSSNEVPAPADRSLLGAAWMSAIVEFGGPGNVRKVYSAKMPEVNVPQVAQILGTTPAEVERKWQLWMYSYLAGMPGATHSMPMNMEMPHQ